MQTTRTWVLLMEHCVVKTEEHTVNKASTTSQDIYLKN